MANLGRCPLYPARGYATGVVVLDRGGNVMISLRADNAGLHTVENARRKALCRVMGLLTTASVAIDGSKFKAVNTRERARVRQRQEFWPGSISVPSYYIERA